jgi:hypothetical protein
MTSNMKATYNEYCSKIAEVELYSRLSDASARYEVSWHFFKRAFSKIARRSSAICKLRVSSPLRKVPNLSRCGSS